MAANPKPSGDREGTPEYKPRLTRREPASSDAIRTLRYDFQVDGGEKFLEDISWKPFSNLKRRRAQGRISSNPQSASSSRSGRSGGGKDGA